jgi:hypothetical protein
MNLQEKFNFLNFWINKSLGAWYTISELEDLVDRGSIALYNDYQPRASTSQRIKDALSPFKETLAITPSNSVGGLVTIDDEDYLNLLDISIRYAVSAVPRTVQVPIMLYNEDERAERLNSQIDPVTVTSPIGEQAGVGSFQLYPESQYFGKATYYRRPTKPVFGYTVISGRVIVYNPYTSTDVEWLETQQDELLLKALSSIGINLSSADIAQWAQAQTQNNYLGQNHL